jgi:predicted dehydrogenase
MNVGIVGCGLIGRKRATALAGCRLIACADVLGERAGALARTVPGATATTDWREMVHDPRVEIVIVATTNDYLAEVTLAAVQAGRHVLVEKPAARSAAEIGPIAAAARERGVLVRVGFNHRHHPAPRKARELVDAGAVGALMYVRGRYGHGGRPGYDREWRADPARSGGGELIDQGVHLIDLARWFLGDFTEVGGFAHTYYWDMPVDDNGFLLLKTAGRQVAFLHASCTEWKNLFSFEIYGRSGKLHLEGLGGSYGIERLAYYKMRPGMGPPDTTMWEYPMEDDSWQLEFREFLQDIELGRPPAAGLADAHAALSAVESIYRQSGYDHHP